MPPDIAALRAFVAGVRRRVMLLAILHGATAGLLLSIVAAIAGGSAIARPSELRVISAALTIAGILAGLAAARERRGRVIELVERRAPQCRNLLVTAHEMQQGAAVKDSIATMIYARAAALIRGLDQAALFPARNAALAFLAAAAILPFVVERAATAKPSAGPRGASKSAAIHEIVITVVPPAYAKRPATIFKDPARIEALAGSRLSIAIRANADRITMETLQSHDTLASATDAFTKEITATADGYVALEPSTSAGVAGARRLIGVTVIPDEPPRVRISAPGKDVAFSDGHHTIDLAIEASDDIGLASLRVRYTKVSGSGERFTFAEGEVPIQLARPSDSAWTGRARWKLDGLALDAGDMVVYRAVAADRRPGAPPTESDSYIAEVLAPGGNAAAGFSLDPEQERYAVSQQMVILKTERLLARKAATSADDYNAESRDLSGEQRKVRAEFVFMMGGELADAPDPTGDINNLNEEAEAEGEDDLLAGRSANQGRLALLRAIRAMSRASAALTNTDLQTALTHEREALKQLEQAFSRSRILLRALTERERLDLSRRMSGILTDAARDTRPAPEPRLDARTVALRRTLASIAELAAAPTLDASASGRASTLAQGVLRIDASSKPLQEVASALDAAASAIARSDRDARARLDRAATLLAGALKTDVRAAPRQTPSLQPRRMNGALTDALRNPGSR